MNSSNHSQIGTPKRASRAINAIRADIEPGTDQQKRSRKKIIFGYTFSDFLYSLGRRLPYRRGLTFAKPRRVVMLGVPTMLPSRRQQFLRILVPAIAVGEEQPFQHRHPLLLVSVLWDVALRAERRQFLQLPVFVVPHFLCSDWPGVLCQEKNDIVADPIDSIFRS